MLEETKDLRGSGVCETPVGSLELLLRVCRIDGGIWRVLPPSTVEYREEYVALVD
jgi:hypothetical protein